MSHRIVVREKRQQSFLRAPGLVVLACSVLFMGLGMDFFVVARHQSSSLVTTQKTCDVRNIAGSSTTPGGNPVIPSGIISVILPAYWGTDQASWDFLIQRHPPGTIAIINTGNTAGTYSPLLKTQIEQAHQAGIKILGYVSTGYYVGARLPANYVNRSMRAIEADIDAWYNSYPLDGIQLANALLTPANLGFYSTLHDYIRARTGPQVIARIIYINGASVPSSLDYMKVADIFKIYENTLSGYQKQTFPLWIQEYPSSHFAATISEVPTALQILQIIRLSLQANVGYIYVLDGGLAYNRLPFLWAQEVAALASYDATGKIPTTVIAPVPSPLPPLPPPVPTARPIPRPTAAPMPTATPTPILQLTIAAQQPEGAASVAAFCT